MSQSTTAWDEIFAREGRVFLEPHENMPRMKGHGKSYA